MAEANDMDAVIPGPGPGPGPNRANVRPASRLSLRWNLDPRPHLSSAARAAPRRLRDDLHQVINDWRPVVEQSSGIGAFSTWLNGPTSNPPSHLPVLNPSSSSSPIQVAGGIGPHDYIINVETDQDDAVNNAATNGASSSGGGLPGAGNLEQGNNNYVQVPPTTGGNDNNNGVLTSENWRQNPELRAIISIAEKYLPFVVILLCKMVFDYKIGLLVLVGLVIVFLNANSTLKQEVGKQGKRDLKNLVMLTAQVTVCIVIIYYFFKSDKLYYSLVCMPLPNRELRKIPLTLLDMLWIVTVTDFVLKLITILCKAVVVALPPRLIVFQRKGKYYLFIEKTSQLYRSFTPIQPWLCYLMEAYEGISRIFAIMMLGAYIINKGKDIIMRLRFWKNAFTKLMQNVSYGTMPSKQQLEKHGSQCAICQDDFRHPTMLHCNHIFCEECVSTWFDRDRTCPMCRTQIADDPQWRDGETTFFFQLF